MIVLEIYIHVLSLIFDIRLFFLALTLCAAFVNCIVWLTGSLESLKRRDKVQNRSSRNSLAEECAIKFPLTDMFMCFLASTTCGLVTFHNSTWKIENKDKT